MVYFLSDAHLGANPPNAVPQREEHLANFIINLKGNASHLFIVGDLFEFWYEYRFYIPGMHFNIINALNELKNSGCNVIIIKGNHDFAYGNFFPKQLGIEVCKTYILEAEGRKMYVCHGDGIAKDDFFYRLFRKILDFKPNRFLFSLIHPCLGYKIALTVGKYSRKWNKKCVPESKYLEKARKIMRKTGCDTFVHAHNHKGGIWNVPEGLVVNCGQWLFEENFACIKDGICNFNQKPPSTLLF